MDGDMQAAQAHYSGEAPRIKRKLEVYHGRCRAQQDCLKARSSNLIGSLVSYLAIILQGRDNVHQQFGPCWLAMQLAIILVGLISEIVFCYRA